MLCWCMANQDCFRHIGHKFDVAVSSVHAVIHRILDTLTQHMRANVRPHITRNLLNVDEQAAQRDQVESTSVQNRSVLLSQI